jgi:hypothetical protein
MTWSARAIGVLRRARRVVSPVLLLSVMGLGECPGTYRYFRMDGNLTVTCTSPSRTPPDVCGWVGRGSTQGFIVDVVRPDDLQSDELEVLFDVAGSPDGDPIGGGTLPHGVEAVFAPLGGRPTYAWEVTVTALPDARQGPIYIRAAFRGDAKVAVFANTVLYYQGVSPVHITAGAAPPTVGTPSPSTASGGSTIDIEIPATNLEAPVAIDVGDSGIIVGQTSYDAVSGKVHATLQIPSEVRTGEATLALTSANGDRSADIPFTVRGQARPVLTSFYPNYQYADGPPNVLYAAGADFKPGADLHPAPPSSVRVTYVSSRLLVASGFPAADPSTTRQDFAVETLGGTSDPAMLHVVPTSRACPSLARVAAQTADTLFAGTTAQVRIDGADLDPNATVEVLGSDEVEAPSIRATVLPGATPHPDYLIAEIEVYPGEGNAPPPTGGFHLAVRNPDGLASNPIAMNIVLPPPVRVTSVDVGRIAHDPNGPSEVIETVRGSGLQGAFRVDIEGTDFVTSAPGSIVVDPSGTSLTVTLRLAPLDLTRTGDAKTNLVVFAPGGRSNAVSYFIGVDAPPDPPPPSGCADIDDGGVDLALTSESYGALRFRQPNPLSSTVAGTYWMLRIDSEEKHVDGRPKGTIDINLDEVPDLSRRQVQAQIVFRESPIDPVAAPQIWYDNNTRPYVDRESQSPDSVGLCAYDVDLAGGPTGSPVRLNGHFWVLR